MMTFNRDQNLELHPDPTWNSVSKFWKYLFSLQKQSSTPATGDFHIRRPTTDLPPPELPDTSGPHHHDLLSSLLHLTHSPLVPQPPTINPKPAPTTTDGHPESSPTPPSLLSHSLCSDAINRNAMSLYWDWKPADSAEHAMFYGFGCLENIAEPGDSCTKETHEKLRVVVTGGDGTVGWVLGCLGELHKQGREPVAPTTIIPLGLFISFLLDISNQKNA